MTNWRCALELDTRRNVVSGSTADLADAIGHAADLRIYTDQKLFIIGSHPLVRVRPNVPMRYSSRNWDFGWLMARRDGRVVFRRCDPHTLKFSDHLTHHAIRWFVR